MLPENASERRRSLVSSLSNCLLSITRNLGDYSATLNEEKRISKCMKNYHECTKTKVAKIGPNLCVKKKRCLIFSFCGTKNLLYNMSLILDVLVCYMTPKKQRSISTSPPSSEATRPEASSISLSFEAAAARLWSEYERAVTSSAPEPEVRRLNDRLRLLTLVMIRNFEKTRLETEPSSTKYHSICRKLAGLYHDMTLVYDAARFNDWYDKGKAILELSPRHRISFDRVYHININEIPVFSVVDEDPQLIISDRSLTLFTLKRGWLEGSGIGQRITTRDGMFLTDTSLYLRSRCISQIKFILERSKNRETVDLIVGQPGTGKSLLAFLAGQILSVHHDVDVLWVHIHKRTERNHSFFCIVMHANSRSTVLFDSVDPLLKFMVGDWGIESPRERSRVMFIDGYVDEPPLGTINATALGWLESNSRIRRLIFLSSIRSTNLLTKDDELLFDVRTFHQWSWRYTEYEKALESEDFRNRVANQLCPSPTANDELIVSNQPQDRFINLRAKYFYAGGSARFMFELTTYQVKNILDRLLEQEVHMERLAQGTGQGNYSPIQTHSLLSVFANDQREPISEYVRERICELLDAAELLAIARRFKGNASMLGWVFEAFFFKKLWDSTTLTLVNRTCDQSKEVVELTRGERLDRKFDPKFPTVETCPIEEWLRPRSFNQGGYDAVYLAKHNIVDEVPTGTVRFIQCTVATSHDLKLHYCKFFIDAARSSGVFIATHVEFYFVVPADNLNSFTVSSIISPNALEKFKVGDEVWSSTATRVAQQVRIVGLNGWTRFN